MLIRKAFGKSITFNKNIEPKILFLKKCVFDVRYAKQKEKSEFFIKTKENF